MDPPELALGRENNCASLLGEGRRSEIDKAVSHCPATEKRLKSGEEDYKDRLQFSVQAEAGVERLRCPPTTLLTLVENAVRHGIDPSLEGGRIDVSVHLRGARCVAEVRDTGVGIMPGSGGLGTGLSTLRERLELAFAGDADLRLTEVLPHGVLAEVEFPAQA